MAYLLVRGKFWICAIVAVATLGCQGEPSLSQATAVGGTTATLDSTGGTSGVPVLVGGTTSGVTMPTGGTNGNLTGGAAASGGSTQSSTTVDCVDVCSLNGAPCCGSGMGCVTPVGACVIDVLAGSVDTTYEYADLEKKVAAMPQDVLVSLTDVDFDWSAADSAPSARFQLHMTASAAARYGNTLIAHYPTHPFRLSCGGSSLFLGVMYIWYGQAALDTPVMDAVYNADGELSLYLGAWEGAWGGLGARPVELRERIDRPELRFVFCHRGALKQLAPNALPPNP